MSERTVEILHGVNFDVLELRDGALYGGFSLAELEEQIKTFARQAGFDARFFQTNSERELVERLHAIARQVRHVPGQRRGGAAGASAAQHAPVGLILNMGAWTHYAWAIHDALDVVGLPAVEVHLSDISAREDWRRLSVIGDLCLATFAGHGVEGYRLAIDRLAQERGGSTDGGP
ncbi:MAG: type II 3-dehydroquinate dehydratase [Solirubrobacteraceae bacterium]